jgi:hypothetical protein
MLEGAISMMQDIMLWVLGVPLSVLIVLWVLRVGH